MLRHAFFVAPAWLGSCYRSLLKLFLLLPTAIPIGVAPQLAGSGRRGAAGRSQQPAVSPHVVAVPHPVPSPLRSAARQLDSVCILQAGLAVQRQNFGNSCGFGTHQGRSVWAAQGGEERRSQEQHSHGVVFLRGLTMIKICFLVGGVARSRKSVYGVKPL